MNKLTILLIIIAIVGSGVIGFVLGAQNSQMIPTVNVGNNTTNESDYSSYDTPKTTKNTTKKTNTTTVKKNTTTPVIPVKPVTNTSGNST